MRATTVFGLIAVSFAALAASAAADAPTITSITCDYNREGVEKDGPGGARLRDSGKWGTEGYAIVVKVDIGNADQDIAVVIGSSQGDEVLPAQGAIACFEPTASGIGDFTLMASDHTPKSGEAKLRIDVAECPGNEAELHAVAYYAPYKNAGKCVVSDSVTVGKLQGVTAVIGFDKSEPSEGEIREMLKEAIHAIDTENHKHPKNVVNIIMGRSERLNQMYDGIGDIGSVLYATSSSSSSGPIPGANTYKSVATVQVQVFGGYEAAKETMRELRKFFFHDGAKKGHGRRSRAGAPTAGAKYDGPLHNSALLDSDLWRAPVPVFIDGRESEYFDIHYPLRLLFKEGAVHMGNFHSDFSHNLPVSEAVRVGSAEEYKKTWTDAPKVDVDGRDTVAVVVDGKTKYASRYDFIKDFEELSTPNLPRGEKDVMDGYKTEIFYAMGPPDATSGFIRTQKTVEYNPEYSGENWIEENDSFDRHCEKALPGANAGELRIVAYSVDEDADAAACSAPWDGDCDVGVGDEADYCYNYVFDTNMTVEMYNKLLLATVDTPMATGDMNPDMVWNMNFQRNSGVDYEWDVLGCHPNCPTPGGIPTI